MTMMRDEPTDETPGPRPLLGLVTFLLTDIEASSRLWEQDPAAMREAVRGHEELLTAEIEGNGGRVIKSRGEGDSVFAVFPMASDAASAAVAVQRALATTPGALPLRVRVALHTGEAHWRDGDYYGAAVNRCARIRSMGHGGQVLLSTVTHEIIRDSLADDLVARDLGRHRLEGLSRPERIWQLSATDLPREFPGLRRIPWYRKKRMVLLVAGTVAIVALVATALLLRPSAQEARASAIAELVPNLDFEAGAQPDGRPKDWFHQADEGGFRFETDSEEVHSGIYSGRMTALAEPSAGAFGTLARCFSPGLFVGKDIRYSGYLRTELSSGGVAGLWMRVEKGERSVRFDNMHDRFVRGSTNWTLHEIKLDVPRGSTRICFGVLMAGVGRLWIDDLTLETITRSGPGQ